MPGSYSGLPFTQNGFRRYCLAVVPQLLTSRVICVARVVLYTPLKHQPAKYRLAARSRLPLNLTKQKRLNPSQAEQTS